MLSISIIPLLFTVAYSQVNFNGRFIPPQSSQGCSGRQLCQAIVSCDSRTPSREVRSKICSLPNGSFGLCCTALTSANVKSFFPEAVQNQPQQGRQFSSVQIQTAFRNGESFAQNISQQVDQQLSRSPPKSAAFFHGRHQGARPRARTLTIAALSAIEAARSLARDFGANTIFRGTDISNTIFNSQCPRAPRCDFSSRFRTTEGVCNSRRQPLYGKSFTPMQRILPSSYKDGLDEPRVSITGLPLPSARLVSTTLTTDREISNPTFSNLLMAMGQFIDHDVALAPVFSTKSGEPLDCCVPNGQFLTPCLPISIPPNDPSFRGRSCLNFVRTLPAPTLDCVPGPAEQMDQLTHWLDSSNVYGSTTEEENNLRAFSDGKLRTQRLFRSQMDFLPDSLENEECRNPRDCFLAGDFRVNEQPLLAIMHTLFLREHNRIAGKLSKINVRWNDERLYQETRRILNGMWQHIIFNEWLPIVLGETLMENFGLWTLSSGFSQDYRDDFDPRVTNEFAAAAFRFGHTLVPGIMKSFSTLNKQLKGVNDLKESFNAPGLLKVNGMLDKLLKGLILQPVQEFDNSIASDLTEHLFEVDNDGMDLIALNIQRGRDHGLQGYIDYRKICGTGIVNSFSDLRNSMSRDKIELLKRVYRRVEDIDLFIGMILENPFRDAYVGQTFLCIIADQFARFKKGDRYFYDLGGQAGSFTLAQLHEIRKISMSRIICDNSDGITSIQPLAFRQPDNSYNTFASCKNTQMIPEVNLEPWRE